MGIRESRAGPAEPGTGPPPDRLGPYVGGAFLPSRISRDILRLVPSSFRLLPIALFSVSLFAIDRLRPVAVAEFPSYASAVTFDYNGSCYVSQGRVISRVTSQGVRSVWAETGAPKG